MKQLFSYDANGDVISVNYNGTEYYYLRNGQTDIVGLMDASGNPVVEYIYDAWGKLITTTGQGVPGGNMWAYCRNNSAMQKV